ncbi:uncharacterized protein LOC132204373 isoform X2 [Neocloeon triangulifer]|uniref:uncharacterized protein LOC132204373 isoform X2 n=1 Tax=Neocloeon triangulifer TaxID=2078957 RepID=UPI00286F8F8E|nr:uncharacterized protein LOC132204373 isoform X2 [Neocloeon triangulifer]
MEGSSDSSEGEDINDINIDPLHRRSGNGGERFAVSASSGRAGSTTEDVSAARSSVNKTQISVPEEDSDMAGDSEDGDHLSIDDSHNNEDVRSDNDSEEPVEDQDDPFDSDLSAEEGQEESLGQAEIADMEVDADDEPPVAPQNAKAKPEPIISIDSLINHPDCPEIFKFLADPGFINSQVFEVAKTFVINANDSHIFPLEKQRELIKIVMFAMGHTKWSIADCGWTLKTVNDAGHMLNSAYQENNFMPLLELNDEGSKWLQIKLCNFLYGITDAAMFANPDGGGKLLLEFLYKFAKKLTNSFACYARYTGICIVRAVMRVLLKYLKRQSRSLSLSKRSGTATVEDESYVDYLLQKVKQFLFLLYNGMDDMNVTNRIESFEEVINLMVRYPTAIIIDRTIKGLTNCLFSRNQKEKESAVLCFSASFSKLADRSDKIKNFMMECGKYFTPNLRKNGDVYDATVHLLKLAYERGWLPEEDADYINIVLKEHLFNSTKGIAKRAGKAFVERSDGSNIVLNLANILFENKERLDEAINVVPQVAHGITYIMIEEAVESLTADDIDLLKSSYVIKTLTCVLSNYKPAPKERKGKVQMLIARKLPDLVEQFKYDESLTFTVLKLAEKITPTVGKNCGKVIAKLIKDCIQNEEYLNETLQVLEKFKNLKEVEDVYQEWLDDMRQSMEEFSNNIRNILSSDSEDLETYTTIFGKAKSSLNILSGAFDDLLLTCKNLSHKLATDLEENSADAQINEDMIIALVNLEFCAYVKFDTLKCNGQAFKEHFPDKSHNQVVKSISDFRQKAVTGFEELLNLDCLEPYIKLLVLTRLFGVIKVDWEYLTETEINQDFLIECLNNLLIDPPKRVKDAVQEEVRREAFASLFGIDCLYKSKKISAAFYLALGKSSESSYMREPMLDAWRKLFGETIQVKNSSAEEEHFSIFAYLFELLMDIVLQIIKDHEGAKLEEVVIYIQKSTELVMNCLPDSNEFVRVIVNVHDYILRSAVQGKPHFEVMLRYFAAPMVDILDEERKKYLQKKYKNSLNESHDFHFYNEALTSGFHAAVSSENEQETPALHRAKRTVASSTPLPGARVPDVLSSAPDLSAVIHSPPDDPYLYTDTDNEDLTDT